MIISTRQVTPMERRPMMVGTKKKKSRGVSFFVEHVTHKVVRDPYRNAYAGASTVKEPMVLIVSVEGHIDGVRAFFTHRSPFSRYTNARGIKDVYAQDRTEFVYVNNLGNVHVLIRIGETMPCMAIVTEKQGKNGGYYFQLTQVRRKRQ